MIHYYVWFSFHAGVQPDEGLHRVRTFLEEMTGRGLVREFHLLRNRDAGANTARAFKAAIVFADAEAFSRGFEVVEQAGVRSGLHGLMVDTIKEFAAEVFEGVENAAADR